MNEKAIKKIKTLTALFLAITVLLGITPASAFAEETAKEENSGRSSVAYTTVDDSFTEDKWHLILNYPSEFSRMTYRDTETGLYIHYRIFLPEKYDRERTYPLVVFLADEKSTGSDPDAPLVQGRGALVWAAEEWQKEFPCIIAVPVYRERILDNQLYTVTDYVKLTENWIHSICTEYAVNNTRVYGTGQGMGCETLMLLAAENPDLFAACMFVGGLWDAERLRGLEKQRFIFFSAEGDREVWTFAQKLMEVFGTDGIGYAHAEWDAGWNADRLSAAGITLTTSSTGHYFVSWKWGTVIPDADVVKKAGDTTERKTLVHLASFDEAYRSVAVMEWLFHQVLKEIENR